MNDEQGFLREAREAVTSIMMDAISGRAARRDALLAVLLFLLPLPAFLRVRVVRRNLFLPVEGLARSRHLSRQAQEAILASQQRTAQLLVLENPRLHPAVQLGEARKNTPRGLASLLGNPSFRFTDEMPVSFMSRSVRGLHHMRERAQEGGLETETFDSLRDEWEGTLGELLTAASTLGPETR